MAYNPYNIAAPPDIASVPTPVLAGYVSILWFGAKFDGTTNDTAAFNAAVNYVAAKGGGTIVMPAGTTVLNSTLRTTNPTSTHALDGHAVVITTSNIKFQSAGIGKTIVQHNAYGGGNFQAPGGWQVVSGLVWRGAAFFICPQGGGTITGTQFDGFTIDGGYTPTGNSTIPANTITGDGWDDTFHTIWMADDLLFNQTRFTNMECRFYSGELIAGAGIGLGFVYAVGNYLHDTNGDCYSVQAQHIFCNNRLTNCYGNGIDSCQGGFNNAPSLYSDNVLENCYIGINIALLAGYTGVGFLSCINNQITNSKFAGIAVSGYQSAAIDDNVLIDCGYSTTTPFQIETGVGLPLKDLSISRNKLFYINQTTAHSAIGIFDGHAAGISNITANDNLVELTAIGAANGNTVTDGYDFTAVTDPLSQAMRNRAIGTTNGATTGAAKGPVLLTTTNPTNVAVLQARKPGKLFGTAGTYIVANATTTVTITYNYRDANGNVASGTLVNAVSSAPGTYQFNDDADMAPNTAGTMNIIATASNANNVTVNAAIVERA